jgi:hypothetical protein
VAENLNVKKPGENGGKFFFYCSKAFFSLKLSTGLSRFGSKAVRKFYEIASYNSGN